MTNPDKCASFKLDEQDMAFICFIDNHNLEDIGFKDTRDAATAAIVPFSETGDNIAFLTRKFHVCEKKEGCLKGDMLLNVLSIDSYSSPMKFELSVTHFEACMEEGMSDDTIQTAISMQVTSARGLDVAFLCQYNDRVVYDCVTSTTQLPIRFPMPANQHERE